jgi:hypothetical protein
MKSRIYFTSVALLLLLTAGIYTFLKSRTQLTNRTDHSKFIKSATSTNVADTTREMDSAKESKSNDRKRPESINPELVAEYGESRVNLSRQITTKLLEIGNDLVEIGGLGGITKLTSEDDEAESGSEVATKLGTISESLNLTTDQTSKAATLIAEASQRRLDAAKGMLKKASINPTGMITQLLISDAAARGEIDEIEFKQLRAETKDSANSIIDSLDLVEDDEKNPLEDEVFVKNFRTLLDSRQQTVIDNELKNLAAASREDPEVDKSNFKEQMRLEEMDTVISSIKMMVSGVKILSQGSKIFQKSELIPSASEP